MTCAACSGACCVPCQPYTSDRVREHMQSSRQCMCRVRERREERRRARSVLPPRIWEDAVSERRPVDVRVVMPPCRRDASDRSFVSVRSFDRVAPGAVSILRLESRSGWYQMCVCCVMVCDARCDLRDRRSCAGCVACSLSRRGCTHPRYVQRDVRCGAGGRVSSLGSSA